MMMMKIAALGCLRSHFVFSMFWISLSASMEMPVVERATFPFSDSFALLWKATISYVMCVRPLTRNNSAPTGRIFVKFEFFFFRKSV